MVQNLKRFSKKLLNWPKSNLIPIKKIVDFREKQILK